MKKGNLVRLLCTFEEKERFKMLFMQCSSSILKDVYILTLINKITLQKQRVPALILPFKGCCTEMQIYLSATSNFTHL